MNNEPSDAAVEAALVEDQPSWHKIPEDLRSELRLRMHAALEAAYRVDAPRPFLDREAVADAIDRHYDEDVYMPIYPEDGSRCIGSAAADAVMELARPMPTREQIDELLKLWKVGPAFRPYDPDYPGALPNYRRKLRDALLALLSGSES